MDLGLKDKRAFVASSSRGLGYAAALLLAKEGCRVAINSRSEENVESAAEKASQESGATVIGLAGDVSDAAVPEPLILQAVEALGGLDILITNAGGTPAGSFESFTDGDWQSAIDISLLSHVRLIRAALPHLRKSESASVLAIISYVVKQASPNLVLSNSIRAATAGLIKSLAMELGRENIRFNSVLPGWTMTERVDELMASRAKTNDTSVEKEVTKQIAEIPLGRMGKPEEFANAAVFLASPAASFVHGTMLPVDGGVIKGTF